jgi:hypothetical protein
MGHRQRANSSIHPLTGVGASPGLPGLLEGDAGGVPFFKRARAIEYAAETAAQVLKHVRGA